MNFKVKMHNVMVDNHIKKRIYTERSTHLNGYKSLKTKENSPQKHHKEPLSWLFIWLKQLFSNVTTVENLNYWGLGGRLLAAETLEPHSSNSLLVSSLWTITSMKHKLSFLGPVAVLMASTSSSSQKTCNQVQTHGYKNQLYQV